MQAPNLVVTCYLCCGRPRLDCPRCAGTGQDPGNLPLTKRDFTTESLLRLGLGRALALVRIR